jgi:hypothetical protein
MRRRIALEPAVTCPWDRARVLHWAAVVTAEDCEPYCPARWHIHVDAACHHTYAVDEHGHVYGDFTN